MADLGFLPSVTRILDDTPAGGQRMLFSATLDRGVDRLVRSYLSDPALHAVTPEVSGAAARPSTAVLVLDRGRQGRGRGRDGQPPGPDAVLRPYQARSRPAGPAAGAGRRARPRRSTATATRTSGSGRWTRSRPVTRGCSSPPTSRPAGIHVDGIELVVHFDPPNDHKDYLHRSGRTARAGRDRAGRHASSAGAGPRDRSGCTRRPASTRPGITSRPSTRSSRRSRPPVPRPATAARARAAPAPGERAAARPAQDRPSGTAAGRPPAPGREPQPDRLTRSGRSSGEK